MLKREEGGRRELPFSLGFAESDRLPWEALLGVVGTVFDRMEYICLEGEQDLPSR